MGRKYDYQVKKTTEQPDNGKVKITIPHNYIPRNYQRTFWEAMSGGIRRAVLVWHRRAGKDKSVLNFTIVKMLQRVGIYYYFFPTYSQGKKIIWDGIDGDGFKLLDHFPTELIANRNETEMKIELKNGSIFQVIGTDNWNSIMGTNPVGCVFSEYSLQDPRAWDYVRPIMRENKGWAIFVFTPRGKNHAYKLLEAARKTKGWFTEVLTVKNTFREDGTRVITDEDIEEERSSGMDEDLIQQEFYCSFSGSAQGSYYGKLMTRLEDEGHVTNVPWEPGLPVHTAWDLGVGDGCAIWFFQRVYKEIRLIDTYSAQGEGIAHYAKMLQEKPYVYGDHIAPHDITVRELTTGKSRLEVARKLGIRFKIAKKLGREDGIEAVRNLLPQCWFDKDKTATDAYSGVNALFSYHKVYDEKRREFRNEPEHDWACHYADAFRMLAVGINTIDRASAVPPPVETDFSIWDYEKRAVETDFDVWNTATVEQQ